jgi:hypothetical protein
MPKKHAVALTDEQRQELDRLVNTGVESVRKTAQIDHAYLLGPPDGDGQPVRRVRTAGRVAAEVQGDRAAGPADFACFVRDLLDGPYRYATKVVSVMDNLNTHGTASLNAALPPAEARRLAERLVERGQGRPVGAGQAADRFNWRSYCRHQRSTPRSF